MQYTAGTQKEGVEVKQGLHHTFLKNYFINQPSAVHNVTSPKFESFMVDDTYVFEVGGGSKTTDQIQGIPNAYLALDIESGNCKRIPLCLFGMLY